MPDKTRFIVTIGNKGKTYEYGYDVRNFRFSTFISVKEMIRILFSTNIYEFAFKFLHIL